MNLQSQTCRKLNRSTSHPQLLNNARCIFQSNLFNAHDNHQDGRSELRSIKVANEKNLNALYVQQHQNSDQTKRESSEEKDKTFSCNSFPPKKTKCQKSNKESNKVLTTSKSLLRGQSNQNIQQPCQFSSRVKNVNSNKNIQTSTKTLFSNLKTPEGTKQSQYLLKYLMQLQNSMKKSWKNVSTEERCAPEEFSFGQKASKRSLLTQKLKNLESQPSEVDHQEQLQCYEGKILVKESLIMKQMRRVTRVSMTQPIMVSSECSDLIEEKKNKIDLHSQQRQNDQYLKGSRISRKKLLGKMQLQAFGSKQRKAKQDLFGCSKCEIY